MKNKNENLVGENELSASRSGLLPSPFPAGETLHFKAWTHYVSVLATNCVIVTLLLLYTSSHKIEIHKLYFLLNSYTIAIATIFCKIVFGSWDKHFFLAFIYTIQSKKWEN